MGMAMMGTGEASGENRAVEAAEKAISSPLLEDISLAGAKGVLVNITAGMDMSIGEFEEVGEVIKSFTSDQATVVVGTVIDPEMRDELRVTIVVTGLANAVKETAPREFAAAVRYAGRPSRQQGGNSGALSSEGINPCAPKAGAVQDGDYLDIPAFLRRQSQD